MSMFFNRILSLGKVSDEDRFEAHIKQWIPLALLIGIVVGIFMSAFYVVILLIAKSLSYLSYPLIGMAIGGIIIAILVYVKFENPNENGITYVISQRHNEKPIPPEVGAKKFVNSSITIGAGLPVGREGPALIIGSAIATKIASWGNVPEEYQHQAITLGSAASTGALFQAPFGSAIFAAEVPYKEDSDEPMLMAAFLASVTAAVTAKSIISFVNSNIIEITLDIFNLGIAELKINVYNSILAILLGIITGLIGRVFIEFYYNYTDQFIQRFRNHIQILLGLSIALFVIIIGLILIPEFHIIEGISSFDIISDFITDAENEELRITVLLIAIIIEIIATTAIIGSGFPGGIFGPSLSIGAQAGIIFAILLNITNPVTITAWAIVGMSGAHAATTKTPVASVLLILEITGLPNLIIPMVLANISSYVVSGPRSLYRGQLRSRDAKLVHELRDYDQHEGFTIENVMTPKSKTVYATQDMLIADMKTIVTESSKRDFPVIQSSDDYLIIGMIYEEDILRIDEKDDSRVVSDYMSKNILSVNKQMTGREALQIMLDNDVERAPVIDEREELIGIVSIGDIIRGHRKLHEISDI